MLLVGMHISNDEVEWAREKEITRRFGLSHMILYRLRTEGKIRTVSLQEYGKKQGARLYCVSSVRAYLENLERREQVVMTD